MVAKETKESRVDLPWSRNIKTPGNQVGLYLYLANVLRNLKLFFFFFKTFGVFGNNKERGGNP